MYELLRDRVAELIAQPRELMPQMSRQLPQFLEDHHAEVGTFLLCAAEVLEEDELEILFAPHFTPTLEQKAAIADVMYHWTPSREDVARLVPDVCAKVGHAVVILTDGAHAKVTLHEVMVDRFVRLLRLESAPSQQVAASLRKALPAELWSAAAALVRQRGFNDEKQAWFARFVAHLTLEHQASRGLLETAAQFVGELPDLEREAMVKEANQLVKSAQGSVAYAQGGRTYWSPDVAQHHHYRGQGQVDEDLVRQRQNEVEWLEMIASSLQGFHE